MRLAVVMVLQRFEGSSDREAVDRFAFDARWKYAAGGLSSDYPSFVLAVLVDMRARLRVSERPDRILEAVLDTAKQARLVGRRRVLDSTSLCDAVGAMDTVTVSAQRSAGCWARATGWSRRSCAVCSRAMTITRALGSRSVNTRTASRGRS